LDLELSVAPYFFHFYLIIHDELQASEYYYAADSPQIFTDPSNTDKDTATLRLYALPHLTYSYDGGEETEIIEDTVDSSVISGFAAAGGLWTFINGLFIIIFGGSILFFSFGKFLVNSSVTNKPIYITRQV
jgi:hypothetical protein